MCCCSIYSHAPPPRSAPIGAISSGKKRRPIKGWATSLMIHNFLRALRWRAVPPETASCSQTDPCRAGSCGAGHLTPLWLLGSGFSSFLEKGRMLLSSLGGCPRHTGGLSRSGNTTFKYLLHIYLEELDIWGWSCEVGECVTWCCVTWLGNRGGLTTRPGILRAVKSSFRPF